MKKDIATGSIEKACVDLSTAVHAAQVELGDLSRRREQWRRSQQKRRNGIKSAGGVYVQLWLVAADALLYRKAVAMQSGPVEDCALRALRCGLKFLANSGNVRGGKERLK